MIYCFLDTNIFLQYQTFDEIDWSDILNTDKVCLVVPKKVIQELDKHKNDPTSNRRRKRASIALRKIFQYYIEFEGIVRPQITLDVQTTAPRTDWLEENGYNPSDNDDCIVGAAHFFKVNNLESRLIILAGDYGVRLKALASEIPQIVPPEELKLATEPDPLQKQNQELQQELQRLKNRRPELIMQIGDGKGKLSHIVDFYVNSNEVEDTAKEIEKKLQIRFELFKYEGQIKGEKNSKTSNVDFAPGLAEIGIIYPSQEEVVTYHLKLNEYLQNEYRDYLILLRHHKNYMSLICPVNLALINNGTLPADNVDVWLHFPDGFQIYDEVELPPYEPTPPTKPKSHSMFDSLLGGFSSSLIMPPMIRDTDYSTPSGPSISIRKTNSYEIEWGPIDLKHNHQYELPELYLLFDPINDKSTGFEVEYKITSSNLPDIVKGKLIMILHSE